MTTKDEPEQILLSKEEIARAWDVSLPTVDKWLADIKARLAADPDWGECPVAQWGGNGKAYKIDPDRLQRWRDSIAQAERQAEAARLAEIESRQRSLDLTGGDVQGEAQLPIKIRKDMAAVIISEARAMEERGRLVDVASVQAEFEHVFQYLASQLQGLSDFLQRECNLGPVETALVYERTLEWQEQLARKLMAGDDDEGSPTASGGKSGTAQRGDRRSDRRGLSQP